MLAVNGEIYNHRDIRKRLEGIYPFATGSDCEVILALYREKGADFLEEIIGLFYGGGFHFLGVQALGVLAIVAWAFCLGWMTMKVLDKTMGIRVDPRIEEEGLDIYEHGETAYNS